MISIKNISKTFQAGTQAEVRALIEVNLEIGRGEFVVLLGSNGSGKSTLLNSIAGNVIPDSGSVSIHGSEVTKLPDYKRSRWVARVFQDPNAGTAPDLSLADNFRLAALRTGRKGLKLGVTAGFKKEIAERLTVLGLGLETQLLKNAGTLSGGQRQAITLLMASMEASGVLLLDEPTAALDPKTARQVMELANKLIGDNQLTAVLVTHNLREALQYGSRIVQMSEGKVVRDIRKSQSGTPSAEEIFSWF